MKKIVFSIGLILFNYTVSNACAYYDMDGDYFNLFTQDLIKDKSLTPFLLTYESRFYGEENNTVQNENILQWQQFFNGKLTYNETLHLIFKMPVEKLIDYRNGFSTENLLKKLGNYYSNKEAIEYLIIAKKIEPFMNILPHEEGQNWYFSSYYKKEKSIKNINFNKTLNTLEKNLSEVKNKEIKLRYAYQIVRLFHYKKMYKEAVAAFNLYVKPLENDSAIYYMAVDQYGGALNGLKRYDDANQAFLQAFINLPSLREQIFLSFKLKEDTRFFTLVKNAKTKEEKAFAHFLLGYDSFSNPMGQIENIYNIDPNSELLKVMIARAVNGLERSYLPITYRFATYSQSYYVTNSNTDNTALYANPLRLPLATNNFYDYYAEDYNYLKDLHQTVVKIKKQSSDAYWKMVDAYLHFLLKDYKKSESLLATITTDNEEYLAQIESLNILIDIVSQPVIDPVFEEKMYAKYRSKFISVSEPPHYLPDNKTNSFVRDIIANRYFLQKEYGKSFLMTNKLSALGEYLDLDLVKSVKAFYDKKEKNNFEKHIISKNIEDLKDAESFFELIFGNLEMKKGNFAQAKQHFEKVKNFKGLKYADAVYIPEKDEYISKPREYKQNEYNGFSGIPSLVFGYNKFVSYESVDTFTMRKEPFSFPFIKPYMNKLELVEAALQLQKIGQGKGVEAANANQLLANMMYNTSILGYYRHLFVNDINNRNGGKFNFVNPDHVAKNMFLYYDSWLSIPQEDFDQIISYYQKALNHAKDDEQKARILFQMASAEQGTYYQWEANQTFNEQYDSKDWTRKINEYENKLLKHKRANYKKYFAQLKKYAHTHTYQDLRATCSYFDYYVR